MKRKAIQKSPSSHIEELYTAAALVVVGAGAVWYFFLRNAPITVSPGTMTVKSPGANATVQLPAGAKGWTSISYQTSATSGSSSIAAPATPTASVSIPSPTGASAAIAYTDANGQAQTTTLIFS